MHIKQVAGGHFDFDIGSIATVKELVVALQDHTGQGDAKHFALYYNGHKLRTSEKLSKYQIDNNSTLTYMSDLDGGCSEQLGCNLCGAGCSEKCCCSIL